MHLNDLVLEIFENLFIRNFLSEIWIQHPKFSFIANFHIPMVCDFNCMVIINLRIEKGFSVKTLRV